MNKNIKIKYMMINPTDIEISNNLSVLQSLLKCKICNGVVVNPYQCKNCDNIFCKQCILTKKCPNCKGDIKENKIFKELTSKLLVKCKNGCGELIPFDDYKEHMEIKCKKIDYKEGLGPLREKLFELTANEIQIRKVLQILKMNAANYSADKISHFGNLIKKHKRCKMQDYEIKEIEDKIIDTFTVFRDREEMVVDCYE